MSRTVVRETRSLDHMYDPTFVSAAPVDHNKLTMKALSTNYERVPEAANYFSELKNYPRATLRPAKGKDNFIPKYVDPSWHPNTEADSAATMVHGADRFKYDRRPLVKMGAFASGPGPQLVMYDMQRTGQTEYRRPTQQVLISDGPTRTVGTQSMYRESEAQTVPYTPDFVATTPAPEILTLQNLTFDNGLPATLFEVKIIERTRQKRIFEQMLPPTTDEFSLAVRAQLLEQQEFKEWAERERQIVSLQERRLAMVKELIAEREMNRKVTNDAKIDRLRVKKAEEKDRLFASTQYKKIKLLRKMFSARVTALSRNTRPEAHGQTVAKYQDRASSVYAPLTRYGSIPDTHTGNIEIQPADLKSYSKLLQLERTLPASVFLPGEIRQETLIPEIKRQDVPIVNALNEAMQGMNAESERRRMGDMQPMGDTAAFKSPHHESSPKRKNKESAGLEEQAPEDEEKMQALLLLQRILRGRAIQNRMFEGKEKRLDLIEELRAAEMMMASERPEDKEAKEALQAKIMEEDAEDQIIGSVVSKALDDLSKELERVQELRRIDAMMKLAERERRMRQASEGGRRQAEERLRAREDEIFRQVMKDVHQGTVDSYLEDILTNAVETTARENAMAEAKAQAAKINDVVDSLDKEPEACVRELVGSFIVPHAQREIIQRRITLESKRFIDAARDSLDTTMGTVENELRARELKKDE
ncbi:unnamed protein product [Amoebophrya sp. A25]|nr:unnamed protein product [Amoebophrya sp. A25]|eukprot:GSA25T00001129001.1